MSVALPERALSRLARLLLDKIGLRSSAEAGSGLRLALSARLEAVGEKDAEAYVDRLCREDGAIELRALLPLVTVGKTEFFRDLNQFRALRHQVVPELLARARREMRRLAIWSGGCATGEEAYSLAIVLAELGVEPSGAQILGTDLNPQAVELAQQGRFPDRRVAGLPEAVLKRYFTPDGDAWRISSALRSYIRFSTHNLASPAPFPAPEGPGGWDLVVCRNVLIYFERATMVRVVRRFHEALSEGGYLCLGYSESLFRVSSEFELADLGGAFVYRRPTRVKRTLSKEQPRGAEVPRARAVPKPAPRSTPSPAPGTAMPPAPKARTLSAEIAAAREPMSAASELLERGRFDQATRMIEDALQRAPGNVALLLTHGNAMLMLSRFDQARSDYRRALEIEPLCAEAHLFLGIACAEGGAEMHAEAAREVGRAIFLDPHLPLAHYFAGRLAEQAGDRVGARRAYRNAIDASRKGREVGPLMSVMPDLPADPAMLARAARYALAALEEHAGST